MVSGSGQRCRSSQRLASCATSTAAAPAITTRSLFCSPMALGQSLRQSVDRTALQASKHSTLCQSVSAHVMINGVGEDKPTPRHLQKSDHDCMSTADVAFSGDSNGMNWPFGSSVCRRKVAMCIGLKTVTPVDCSIPTHLCSLHMCISRRTVHDNGRPRPQAGSKCVSRPELPQQGDLNSLVLQT